MVSRRLKEGVADFTIKPKLRVSSLQSPSMVLCIQVGSSRFFSSLGKEIWSNILKVESLKIPLQVLGEM